MQETTKFEDSGKRTYIAGLTGYTITAEQYYQSEALYERLGEEVVLVLYTDATANLYRYEGFAFLQQTSIATITDAVIKEPISFQGNQELYYREG